jgi:phospholipid/cholesterol/gamma-HCH transport system permease protein
LNLRLLAALSKPPPLRRWRALLHHFDALGVRTLPLTLIVSGLLGYTGVFLARGSFEFLYHRELPTLLGRVFVEQIAPLITTFLVIGGSIVSMTAELASMRVAREIDSLEIVGQDPVEFLLLPRLVALSVALPALTFFAFFASMAGGWLAARQPGTDFPRFAEQFFGIGSPRVLGLAIAVRPQLLVTSLLKAVVSAWAILIIGGYFGLGARGDQEESVGRAVRHSVAGCLVAVTFINLLFAVAGHG